MKAWIVRISAALLIAAVAATAGYYSGAQDKPAAQRTLKTNQIARVGDRVFSAEEFIERLVERERQSLDPDLRTARWALESLLIEEMLALEAERIGARPNRMEITALYDKMMEDWERAFKQLNEQLAAWQRANGLEEKLYSREEFIEHKHNMTPIEFEMHQKEIARQELLRRMVVNYWRVSTINARADAIFMRSDKDLSKVRERLMKGEKFEVLAGEFSEDLITRQHGGMLGTVYPKDGTFESPELEEAFWALKKGETTDVIKVKRGYWIVRKTDITLANEAAFFELRDLCVTMRQPDNATFIKWRHSVAGSGRYSYEERIPGIHTRAGE